MADYPALDLRFQPHPDAEALLHAALDDFRPSAILDSDDSGGWRVFFPDAAARNAAYHALSATAGLWLDSATVVDVPDEDWARRSQAGLRAVTVGRITIAPPWHTAAPPPSPHLRSSDADDHPILIVIDPSMGFGTGHHQTTRLCLSLLQSVTVRNRRIVDVGTGSGVLALAAHRLGAVSVLALDNDQDAVLNARDNLARNGAAEAIELMCVDLAAFPTSPSRRQASAAPADIVTANLTAGSLIQHAEALRRLVVSGGLLIASGFSPADVPEVLRAFGARDVEPVLEDDWAALVIRP